MFVKCQNGGRSTISALVAKLPECAVALFQMPNCVPISDLGIMDSNPTPPTVDLHLSNLADRPASQRPGLQGSGSPS